MVLPLFIPLYTIKSAAIRNLAEKKLLLCFKCDIAIL